MIQYLTRNEINDNKWNAAVEVAVNGLPYAYTDYLDSVVDQQWDALVQDEYEYIMPLPWRKKAGIRYIYPPFFIQQLGIFSTQGITGKKVSEFLDLIPDQYRYIELNLNGKNDFPDSRFLAKRKVTHLLSLGKGYESLVRKYSDNTKRNLRKAQQSNLQADSEISPSVIIQLFQKEKSREVKELKKEDYRRLKNLMESSLRNKRGELYGVKNEKGEFCAGGFFVKDSRTLINLFPISNEEGRKKSAMFFLIDFILNKYSGTNRIFDFEGSEIAGVARFYKGFGGEEQFFPQLKINRLPRALKWLKK